MSYDIDLIVDHGDGYQTNVFEANITYNLRPMLVEAGLKDSLHSLNGLTAESAAPLIGDVWRELYRRPDHYRQWDSPNGWGLHKNLVPWMKRLYIACRTHPRAIIQIS
ncbi:hypothetical protein [Curtobacterium sp. BRD11]|uniref:hypothetical protein n=1 Tax=Curtobacterium sp. BRD11 TaxID=2962581 RepID=UPI0028819872|nr:hypothetical protein [Curtobacterium sp. BRD11]MDT0211208.1 hypothetical protein [Curtobacterium sp. BRD11]